MAETKKKIDTKAYLEEKVPVTLYKDNGDYKNDLVVTINGVMMKIPRGKTVMVPRKYALLIEESVSQGAKAAETMENLKSKE